MGLRERIEIPGGPRNGSKVLAMAIPAIFKPANRSDLLNRTGFLGLLAFALSAWSTYTAHRYALVFCVCAVAVSREARSALWHDAVFRFGLVFAVYLVGQTAWGIYLFPGTVERQILDCGRWLSLFGFLAVASLMRGDPGRVMPVLGLAAVGLWAGMLRVADEGDVVSFRIGDQTGFVTGGGGASGIISATVMLGLLLFAGRILGPLDRPWRFGCRLLGLLAAVYLTAYILVASQTRTAWLALALALPAALGCQYFWTLRSRGFSLRRLPYLPGLAVAVLIGGVLVNIGSIGSRVGPDREVVEKIVRGEADQLSVAPSDQRSSFRERFFLQKFALEKWLERPIAGWGTGSTRQLIVTSGRPELFIRDSGTWIPHLHSVVLEVLVRFGLLGAALSGWGVWLLTGAVGRAELPRRLPEDLLLFLAGGAAIVGLGMLTGSRVLNEYWRLYWYFVMGGIYTFVLHPDGVINGRMSCFGLSPCPPVKS
jgi:hypothetical protein